MCNIIPFKFTHKVLIVKTTIKECIEEYGNVESFQFAQLGPHTDLDGLIIDRADFRNMIAMSCSCKNAKITNTDFYGADLRYADFTGADLTGSDFSFARLDGANFNGAKLDGVDFSSANLTDTIFDNANLSKAKMDKAVKNLNTNLFNNI